MNARSVPFAPLVATPPVLYTRSGDVHLTYQVFGEAELDLVLVQGFASHLDLEWENPAVARFFRGLASFSRLIRFNKRGLGLSDRNVAPAPLEERMDDVRAVMDAVGSEPAVPMGISEGAPMSIALRGDVSGTHGGARAVRRHGRAPKHRLSVGALRWKASLEAAES